MMSYLIVIGDDPVVDPDDQRAADKVRTHFCASSQYVSFIFSAACFRPKFTLSSDCQQVYRLRQG